MLGCLGGEAGSLHREGLDSGEPPSQVASTLGSLFMYEQPPVASPGVAACLPLVHPCRGASRHKPWRDLCRRVMVMKGTCVFSVRGKWVPALLALGRGGQLTCFHGI